MDYIRLADELYNAVLSSMIVGNEVMSALESRGIGSLPLVAEEDVPDSGDVSSVDGDSTDSESAAGPRLHTAGVTRKQAPTAVALPPTRLKTPGGSKMGSTKASGRASRASNGSASSQQRPTSRGARLSGSSGGKISESTSFSFNDREEPAKEKHAVWKSGWSKSNDPSFAGGLDPSAAPGREPFRSYTLSSGVGKKGLNTTSSTPTSDRPSKHDSRLSSRTNSARSHMSREGMESEGEGVEGKEERRSLPRRLTSGDRRRLEARIAAQQRGEVTSDSDTESGYLFSGSSAVQRLYSNGNRVTLPSVHKLNLSGDTFDQMPSPIDSESKVHTPYDKLVVGSTPQGLAPLFGTGASGSGTPTSHLPLVVLPRSVDRHSQASTSRTADRSQHSVSERVSQGDAVEGSGDEKLSVLPAMSPAYASDCGTLGGAIAGNASTTTDSSPSRPIPHPDVKRPAITLAYLPASKFAGHIPLSVSPISGPMGEPLTSARQVCQLEPLEASEEVTVDGSVSPTRDISLKKLRRQLMQFQDVRPSRLQQLQQRQLRHSPQAIHSRDVALKLDRLQQSSVSMADLRSASRALVAKADAERSSGGVEDGLSQSVSPGGRRREVSSRPTVTSLPPSKSVHAIAPLSVTTSPQGQSPPQRTSVSSRQLPKLHSLSPGPSPTLKPLRVAQP